MLGAIYHSPFWGSVAGSYPVQGVNQDVRSDTYTETGPQMPFVRTAAAAEAKISASGYANSPFSRWLHLSYDMPDQRGAPGRVEQDVLVISSPSAALPKMITSLFTAPAEVVTPTDSDAIARIIPSVVRINAIAEGGKEWYGSGAIVKPSDVLPNYVAEEGEYFILTNHHVAEGAKYLTLKLQNGVELEAEVVVSDTGAALLDSEMDIALLRVRVPYELPTATIGYPADLKIGDVLYTAGHPKALPNVSVSKGIISNPAQETGSLSLDIQTDAPINGGNSGGPAFDKNGELVGMNTYTLRDSEDLSFAKPIDLQLDALIDIWEDGEVIRGTLNFEVDEFNLIDRKEAGFPEEITGAMVTDVKAGSSADVAGLQAGDVIDLADAYLHGERFNSLDVNVHDYYEASGVIKRWAAGLVPGMDVMLTVYRKEGGNYVKKEINIAVDRMANAP